MATDLNDRVINSILGSASEDPGAIAQRLNISRMQVVSILAHHKLSQQRVVEREEVDVESAEHEYDHEDDIDTDYDAGSSKDADEDENCGDNDERQLGDYFIGEDVELETPEYWTPGAKERVSNPHLMVMGESGTGKTYALQCLIAEMAHQGIPSIIFDYGQSFESDSLEPVFQKYFHPKEYPIGEKGLSLNPLEIFDKDVKGPKQVATRVADVFNEVFRIGDIQRKVLIEAILAVYIDHGIMPDDEKTWKKSPPNLSSLQQKIDECAGDKEYSNKSNAASLSARMTTFFMLASFNESGWSWDALIDDPESKVQILQFRGLEGKTQRVLVEMLLWHMFFHLKSHGQGRLRLFCVLDEAHHLSFRESGPLASLLREARKFGIGIIFASQQPEDFSPTAYSNSASKLIFTTADPQLKVSKYIVGKAADFGRPEDVRDVISNLKPHDALLISGKRNKTVHIADFPTRTTYWDV